MCREIPLHQKKQKHTFPSFLRGDFSTSPRVCRFPILPQRWQFFLCCFQVLVCFFDVFLAIALELLIQIRLGVLSQDGQIVACLDIQQHKAYQSHPFCKTGKSSITWHAEQLPLSPLSSSFSAAGSPPHTGFIGMELIEFGPNSLPFESDWPHWQEPEGPAWAAITRPCQPQNHCYLPLLPLLPTFCMVRCALKIFWDFKQTLQFGLHIDIPNQNAFVKNLLFSPHQNRWTARSLQYQEPMDGDIPNQGGNPRHCSQRPRSTTCISGRKETSTNLTSKNFPCDID